MAESNGISSHVPMVIHIGRGLTYTHTYRHVKKKLNRAEHTKPWKLSLISLSKNHKLNLSLGSYDLGETGDGSNTFLGAPVVALNLSNFEIGHPQIKLP